MTDITTRCGTIALIGPTNAGKSTLLNALVGAKVSITAPKIHTTRQRIVGILTRGDSQFIFVDTPGLGTNPFEKSMQSARHEALAEADIVLCLVDATHTPDPELLESVEANCPIFLAMNKVDKISRELLLPKMASFSNLKQIQKFYMISALKEQGLEAMLMDWEPLLPISPWRFDEEEVTTLPMKLWAAELTREHVIHLYNKELPYDVSVETEAWLPQKNGSVKVYQTLFVKRDGQKAIVLGARGEAMKRLSERARHSIIHHLGQKIHLFLHVKVVK